MVPEDEFQKALFLALTAIGLTVYDAAPQSIDGASTATFPYVEVGSLISSEWDDQTQNGISILARIHTRSRAANYAEARTIQGQIYTALHHANLTVTGCTSILIMREMSDLNRQPDGSFHGVCEYRALIQTA